MRMSTLLRMPEFSGYCFYINTNKLEEFQIPISVPLKSNKGKKVL